MSRSIAAMAFCLVFPLAAAAASADLAKGTYAWDGYVTATSGTACTYPVGTPFAHFLQYGGAGKSTTALTLNLSSTAGGAYAAVCTKGAVPAGGINGATVSFTCVFSSPSGNSGTFPLSVTFSVADSPNKSAYTGSFIVPENSTCTATNAGLLMKQ